MTKYPSSIKAPGAAGLGIHFSKEQTVSSSSNLQQNLHHEVHPAAFLRRAGKEIYLFFKKFFFKKSMEIFLLTGRLRRHSQARNWRSDYDKKIFFVLKVNEKNHLQATSGTTPSAPTSTAQPTRDACKSKKGLT